jgi:hypothetical protein
MLMDGDDCNLTISELQMVVMGVILGKWRVPPSDTACALKFLLQIVSFLPYDQERFPHRWIEMITRPATRFLDDQDMATPLISLGRRRTNFIPSNPDKTEPNFFGLTQLDTLLSLCESSDAQIGILRRLADRVPGLDSCETYIAFFENQEWRLATTFPGNYGGIKKASTVASSDPRDSRIQRIHCRWTGRTKTGSDSSRSEIILPQKRLPFKKARTMIWLKNPDRTLSFLFGDADKVAVFVADQTPTTPKPQPPAVNLEDLIWAIQYDFLLPVKLAQLFEDVDSVILDTLTALAFMSDVYKSLNLAGATISSKVLLQESLLKVKFWRSGSFVSPNGIWRHGWATMVRTSPQVLAYAMWVIAFCETGGLDIHEIIRLSTEHIVGISSKDSIFVPSRVSHPCR